MSYNQPIFHECTRWNPSGLSFANATTVGTNPTGIFTDLNNSVYATAGDSASFQIWRNGNSNLSSSIVAGLNGSSSIFITLNGDVYVDNGTNNRVNKWSENMTISVPAVYTNGSCDDLFIDTYENIYCSQGSQHAVLKKSFNDDANTSTVVAGNGTNGSGSYLLSAPAGIFVTTSFSLYVADSGNDRVQLFLSGQRDGTTEAGNDAPGTISLNNPSGVVLDGNECIFIVDQGNNRIVGSGPGGFRCIVGCTGMNGCASNQLLAPRRMSFDSVGSIFVIDGGNQRIQKVCPCKKHVW